MGFCWRKTHISVLLFTLRCCFSRLISFFFFTLAGARHLNCTCYCTAEVWGQRCRTRCFLSLRGVLPSPIIYIWLIFGWCSLYNCIPPKLKNICLNGTQATQHLSKQGKKRVSLIVRTLHRGYILINQALNFPSPKFQSSENTPFRSVKNGKRLPAPRIRGMPLESICFMRRWKGEGGGGGVGVGWRGCVTIAGTIDSVTCYAFGWTYKKMFLIAEMCLKNA